MTELTRIRHGLATNSSSSHSMIVVPEGVRVPEELPEVEHEYNSPFVIQDETRKRHYLAGMLIDQAPYLWGAGVLFDPNTVDRGAAPQLTHQRGDPWDARRPNGLQSIWHLSVLLPDWIQDDIRELCGLEPGTPLEDHTAESSLGCLMTIPPNPSGLGPHPIAWAALVAGILDPQTVLLLPEENSWHALEAQFPSSKPGEPHLWQTVNDAARTQP